jgi:hypothetical protein
MQQPEWFSSGSPRLAPSVLPQHPDQYRPERPVLLAVDQELGEGLLETSRLNRVSRLSRRSRWKRPPSRHLPGADR